MKLSLRKANALQLLIKEQIGEQFVGEVAVGKYDDPVKVIEEATDKITATITKKFDLINVLYSIRQKVGQASAESGVSKWVTELALVEAQTKFLKQLAQTKNFAPDVEQVEKQLADLREQSKGERSYYAKDNVVVALLDKVTVEGYIKTVNLLRKSKQTISDQLLHLNVSTEIELDEKEVSLLKKYEIL